jgi:twitching motility protein PilT
MDGDPLSVETSRAVIESLLPARLKDRGDLKDIDCSVPFEYQGEASRFRANVFLAGGHWSACLRHIPNAIPAFDWMGFPAPLGERLVRHANGLVIVTGVAGSGKSTTLAGLVNLLNQAGGRRVITVEEPIEFVHRPISSSMVTQREVGRDVDSFLDGLKYGLRQDPDVILVGEIRDQETAQMALSAAETGHLILTTLHTKDAKGAVTRFVDLFPHEAQDDVRTQLSLSLRSVVSQHLLPAADEHAKRVLALEILHVNHAVRSAIKFGKVEMIESSIQTGAKDGMMTLDDDLRRLVLAQKITMDTARGHAKDADALNS